MIISVETCDKKKLNHIVIGMRDTTITTVCIGVVVGEPVASRTHAEPAAVSGTRAEAPPPPLVVVVLLVRKLLSVSVGVGVAVAAVAGSRLELTVCCSFTLSRG